MPFLYKTWAELGQMHDLLLLRSHICATLTLSTTVSGAESKYVRHSRHTVGDPQKQSVFIPALEALCG